MKWRKFEKKVYDEFHNDAFDIDVMEVWKSIEPQIDELNKTKRKKRRTLLLVLFTGILLTATGIYELGYQKKVATNKYFSQIAKKIRL